MAVRDLASQGRRLRGAIRAGSRQALASGRPCTPLRCALGWAAPLLALVCGAQQGPAPSAPNPLLTTAPAVARTVSGAFDRTEQLAYQQLASYRITLAAGSATTIRLVQEDGALSAAWLSGGEEAHNARRNDMGRGAAISFTLVGSQSGDEIRFLCVSKSTQCSIRVIAENPHPASDADRTRAEAEELLAQGIALHRSADKAARSGASPLYDQALAKAQAVEDLTLERSVLYWRARFLMESQKYADSLAAAQQAVQLGETADDRPGEAAAWKVLGYANAYLGNLNAAIDAYAHAATIYSSTGDRLNSEILEENMARAHRAMGENGKAIEELTAALAEARAIQDAHGIPASLEELGNLRLARGELQPALDAYRDALDALAKWPDDTIHAHALNGIGHVETLLGEFDEATNDFAESVALWRKLKDPMGEAYALDGQGFLAYTTHDYDGAARRFKETLALVQSLHLERESAIILEELGEAEQAAGDPNAAGEAFRQSLGIAKNLHLAGTQADCLRSLGEAAAGRGDTAAARADYGQAEQFYALLGGGPSQALLKGDEAKLERDQGHLAGAEQLMQQALAVIESRRQSIRNADYRSSYFSTQRDYYDLDIALLMEMDRAQPGHGYASRAFEVSERARARALIDDLFQQGIKLKGADAGLIARDTSLFDEIEAQTFAVQQSEESGSGAAAARDKLSSLKQEQERLRNQIRERDPAYATLTQGEIVAVDALERQLLDPGTVLLEYWLGSEHSYLWAVTNHGLQSLTLPAGGVLDEQARRLYANLVARNLNRSGETISSRVERIARADAQAESEAAALARVVLAPAAAIVRRYSNVVVVGEGALASIPFAALPLGGRRLVETHEVSYLPSASVLPQLRANRPPARETRIALIADPVFSASDPRVHAVGAAAAPSNPPIADADDLTRSAGDAGLAEFPRLIYSRQEAEAIDRLVPASQRWSAMDFDANLDAVRTLDWSRFTIAHFSTHALLDTVHPDLSGIVLSLVDEQGRPRDGFVSVRDIYNMRIPTDLVVLSACRTALGKEIRGEGIVGLARAFSFAGSQRVLASLWDVNDHATAELMADFYRRMLKSGLTPATALAQAQRRMAQTATWRAPYFWATFVLQGDWLPSSRVETKP
jgi:CHAT domain-containing protein